MCDVKYYINFTQQMDPGEARDLKTAYNQLIMADDFDRAGQLGMAVTYYETALKTLNFLINCNQILF